MSLKNLGRRVADRLKGRGLQLWYHPDYQLPITGIKQTAGIEPRRADYAAWFLVDQGYVPARDTRVPDRVSYEDLARIHDPELLESLSDVETLSRAMGVDLANADTDEILHTVRLGCGATVAAAREVIVDGGRALNLLGGFHHASPTRAAGFCLVNDIAVAVARLRLEGFGGQIVVIDLDAHPPDGTALCLRDDPRCWIGSLSGVDWGPMPGVDETVLPPDSGDRSYLEALEALLRRAPEPDMAFVIAGGDVLAGDRLGQLGLSLEGARRRDRRVARWLRGVPSVWLPGGGYSSRSWRALAGTGLELLERDEDEISDSYEPLERRFEVVSGRLEREKLSGDVLLTEEDLVEALGMGGRRRTRLLGYYTAEGIEYGLYQYGLLTHLERLGYGDFKVAIDAVDGGDRVQLTGAAEGQRYLLVEQVLDRRKVAERDVLYIHWTTLRNPRAAFGPRRPQLPGQDAPGLGQVEEVVTLLVQMARRLGLSGLAYNPGWYHTAYIARRHFTFLDPARQGRFLALLRDLGHRPLAHVTAAMAGGRVRMNGEPYRWEPDLMVQWHTDPPPFDSATVAAERERVRFLIEPAA
jgi:acetoin utilization deacetylase AcuC-like enzyme